jgi:hypothetical protein
MTSIGTGVFHTSTRVFGFSENTSVSENSQFSGRFTPYGFDLTLSQTAPHVFASAPHGYGAQTPLAVTISVDELLGTAAVGELSIALIGANPAAFTLNRTTISVAQGDAPTFTVTPAAGLAVGVYNAMVSVSAPLSFFTVSFTVKQAGTGTVSIDGWTHGETPSVPQTEDGTGEATFEYKVADADDDTYSATVPTNAGNYTVRATFAESATHMAHAATYNFTISKADPQYTLPEGLTGRIGAALSSVALPTAPNGAWSWINGETVIDAPIGEQEFSARFIPTNSVNFNIIENIDVTVNVICSTTAINSSNRVIPGEREEEAVINIPVIVAGDITVGPNPVTRQAGAVNIFRVGRQIIDGSLTVYDASGNFVRRVSINDNASGSSAARVIGSWDFTDSRGKPVAEGTYLLRGVVTTTGGSRERVSVVIGVR